MHAEMQHRHMAEGAWARERTEARCMVRITGPAPEHATGSPTRRVATPNAPAEEETEQIRRTRQVLSLLRSVRPGAEDEALEVLQEDVEVLCAGAVGCLLQRYLIPDA